MCLSRERQRGKMMYFNIPLIVLFLWSLSCEKMINRAMAMPLSLSINNCQGARLKFKNTWPISLDQHCHEEKLVYNITASYSDILSEKKSEREGKIYSGIYEPYGRTDGVERYEYVLTNGTTFKLFRRRSGTNCFWIISRGNTELFSSDCDRENRPSLTGWKSISSLTENNILSVEEILIEKPSLLTRRLNLKNYRKTKIQQIETNLLEDTTLEPSQLLSSMLHPAVGSSLGQLLHKRYTSDDNIIDSITIDGLFNETLLSSALDFRSIPLSQWVGPETADYCCAKKYRLSFQHWAKTRYAKALQSIVSDDQFIEFLQALTGIDDLIPMKIAREELQWAGSNVIGVAPGGYLYVHNDFNTWAGLHRRINVLLYLNEDWDPTWGGNLEIWDHNNTRCRQSIPPLFNRMSIFTVTDDAYHGHPEPLNSPPGVMRYALQIVYYTKEQGEIYSSHNSQQKKRFYSQYHGAIFQPPCPISQKNSTGKKPKIKEINPMKQFCSQYPTNSQELRCECNFREF